MMFRKNRTLKLITLIMIIISLFFSSTIISFGATKTKKMTVYDEVIKSGRYLYCCDRYRIYRVDIKTKRILNLVKRTGAPDEGYGSMRKKGKYIYCLYYMQGEDTDIFKLKTTKKSPKKLNKRILYVDDYYLSKNRFYYSGWELPSANHVNRVMKLNGKSVKKSNVKCKNLRKKSNAKGYRVIVKDDMNGNVKSWLRFPNGKKMALGKYTYATY